MIIVKMLNNPSMNDNISAFDFAFKLNPTIIGIVGIMQGDNIEITPVKNEELMDFIDTLIILFLRDYNFLSQSILIIFPPYYNFLSTPL